MGSVRMFRDRVVSMEQTQEIGEKHIELLTGLAVEALPGYDLAAHGLDHERDHYWLSLTNAQTGGTRRVVFTRMFLSDANRLPAVVADARAPVRSQIVACIRDQAGRAEIFVTVAGLLTEDERHEREEIEAEWRKEREAALAVRRAEEEERSARERQRQKQQEEARRQAQRERERRVRPAAGGLPSQQPPAAEGGRPGRRRRRGRGGAGGIAGGGRPQQPQPREAGVAAGPRPPQPANAPPSEAARPEGRGGRRRRRRGRNRGPGSPKPGGGGAAPPVSSGA